MIIIQLLKDTKYPANYQIIIDSSLGNYAVLRDFFSALSPRHPGQLLSPADRTSSSATAPRPAASAGCPYQQLHHGTPASNKPHPAEKSTPVWLAIWRTWAGFANSQLLHDAAALSSMQGLPRSGNSSAQTSASLHPPAALRLRVLPFTRRGH